MASKLMKNDLSVAPMYLMVGHKPLYQVIILHVWNLRLTGEKLVLKKLAADCGSTYAAVKKNLDDMVEERIMINEGERDFYPNPYFIPEGRPEPEPKTKNKPKKEFPEWVWVAAKMWKEERGAVAGPNDLVRCVGLVVQEYGLEKTMDAFEEYCQAPKRGAQFDTLNQFRFQVQDYVDDSQQVDNTFRGEFE